MKFRTFLVGVLAIAAITVGYGALTFSSKSPEKRDLNATTRATLSGHFARLSDGVTHYEDRGPENGRVVILVHGASVPLYIWDSTAVALAKEGFRVISYDRYGFGYSDRPDVAYDSTLFVRQLDELAAALGVSMPFDLVGLSFGGYVTAQYVRARAQRVHTWTLIDPVAVARPVPLYLRVVNATPLLREWVWQTQALPAAAEGQSGDFLHPEKFPGWVDRYRPQMEFRGIARAMMRTQISAEHVDYPTLYRRAAQTGVPAMLIWGRQDPVVPFSNSEMVKAAIPGIRFQDVNDAGHLPHMEQSEFVHRQLVIFLKSHTPRLTMPSIVRERRGAVASMASYSHLVFYATEQSGGGSLER